MTKRDKLLKANPELKGKEINARITAEHPDGDEIAIPRKTLYAVIHGLPIPQEFEAYFAEAESKKAEVKTLMNL